MYMNQLLILQEKGNRADSTPVKLSVYTSEILGGEIPHFAKELNFIIKPVLPWEIVILHLLLSPYRTPPSVVQLV